MLNRGLIGSVVLATALWMSIGSAWTFDESKYPDLKGQWQRIGAPRWAKASEAPLTDEYRAIFEANLKDQASGGQGTDPYGFGNGQFLYGSRLNFSLNFPLFNNFNREDQIVRSRVAQEASHEGSTAG